MIPETRRRPLRHPGHSFASIADGTPIDRTKARLAFAVLSEQFFCRFALVIEAFSKCFDVSLARCGNLKIFGEQDDVIVNLLAGAAARDRFDCGGEIGFASDDRLNSPASSSSDKTRWRRTCCHDRSWHRPSYSVSPGVLRAALI